MPRNQRRLDLDSGYADGEIFFPATVANVAGSLVVANNILTKTANGNVSLLLAANVAYNLIFPLGNLVFRYGLQDDLQQQFGAGLGFGASGQPVGSPFTLATASTLAGVNISIPVLSSIGYILGSVVLVDTVASGVQESAIINAIPDGTHIQVNKLVNPHTAPFPVQQNNFSTPASVSGPPPFSGASELVSVGSPRPKGILIRQIHCQYQINAVALTTNAIGVSKTTFAENAALVIDATLLNNGANGLNTAARVNPYTTPITLSLAKQVFQNARFAEYIIEWDITTPVGGTCNVWGFWLDVTYLFN